MITTVRAVHVADAVKQYAIDLVTATRESPDLRLGASPRATLQLLRTARAVAALEGRDYVLPDDLQALAVPVLAHRIIPTAEAQLGRRTTDAIVADLVHRLPLPADRQRSPVRRPEAVSRAPGAARADHPRSLLPGRGGGRGRVCAVVLGERDLLRVAVLLAALPLLAAAYVGQTRYRLACTRGGRAGPGPGRRRRPGCCCACPTCPGCPPAPLLLEDRLPVRARQPAPAGAGAPRRPAAPAPSPTRCGPRCAAATTSARWWSG